MEGIFLMTEVTFSATQVARNQNRPICPTRSEWRPVELVSSELFPSAMKMHAAL